LLTIDNPVNAGYSYSGNSSTINSTQEAAVQLINFLSRFYQIFPSLQKNPVYVAGRSYGGHWAPSLATQIVKQNYKVGSITMNLKGIFLMDGLVSLANQSHWADLYYASGSMLQLNKDNLKAQEINEMMLAWQKQYENATFAFLKLQSYMASASGDNYVNNLRQKEYNGGGSIQQRQAQTAASYYLSLKWTNISTARTQFHIPLAVNFTQESGFCEDPFFYSGDFGTDLSDNLNYLLSNSIKVCAFAGQDDGNIGYPGLISLINGLSWPSIKKFRTSEKKFLYSNNGTIIGTQKSYQNLAMAVLNNCGHLATIDQPNGVYTLLSQFVQGN